MHDTRHTVTQQRHIQDRQNEDDKQKLEPTEPVTHAVNRPGSEYPTPPMPAQQQQKPGFDADLVPQPDHQASRYLGSGKLENQVALITGGDSGIGRSIAILFAREGADVAIIYLCEDEDAQQTKSYVENEGKQCLCLRGDVKDPDFCRWAAEQVTQHYGKLNVLVNNAAFQEHASSLLDLSPERLDETFKTNIYGYIFMAQACLPHLHRGDCIINTSSVTATQGNAQLLDYSSTKGAINAFTYSLANNLADEGIRVNAVSPGPVWTPLNPADRPAADMADFGKGTVFKRPAQPEEIAPAYVYLASSITASFVTGSVLSISGTPGN